MSAHYRQACELPSGVVMLWWTRVPLVGREMMLAAEHDWASISISDSCLTVSTGPCFRDVLCRGSK
jgi:hypothetical protein